MIIKKCFCDFCGEPTIENLKLKISGLPVASLKMSLNYEYDICSRCFNWFYERLEMNVKRRKENEELSE